MKKWKSIFSRALGFFLILTVLCGGLYTLAMTGLSQLIFPDQANGSLIEVDGQCYGSELLAQQFADEDHLWGRIMKLDTATFTDADGNPVMYAAPSNLSPASEEYQALVAERVAMIEAAHPEQQGKPIPVDLVTNSGSGLDPHISPAAAEYQVSRLARTTGKSEEEIRAVIKKYTEGQFLGLFGEPRVNVLKVNLALDGILD